MKTYKSNYAKIYKNLNQIFLYEKEPTFSSSGIELENVEIEIEDNNILILTGLEWLWKYTDEKVYIEDLEENLKPIEKYYKYGYKTLSDLMSRNKKPYVQYWYRLEKSKPLKLSINTWLIKH